MRANIREDFPQFERQLDGRPIVYLDSAATTLKPRSVLEAEGRYSRWFTANVHRGKHALSEEASHAFESARRRVARHLDVDASGVVFVRNATEGLNVVASGLGLRPTDVVLTSIAEHHSNLVPWMRRAKVAYVEHDPLTPISPAQLEAAIHAHRPRVLALGWASNVTGLVHPVAELCRAARALGVTTVVDGAQGAAHFHATLEELGCDYLAFSGHKLLAPAGIGVLAGRPEALERLEPLLLGGGTVDRVRADGFTLKGVPYRLEAGTPNVGGALGLAAALDYLEALGFDALAAHEEALADELARQLEGLEGMTVLQARHKGRLAIASLAPRSEQISPDHVAVVLSDSHQMMVRSGFHCAHPLFDALGLPYGAVRISAYVYNTPEELRAAGRALRESVARLLRTLA